MSGIVHCLGTNPGNPDNPFLTGLIFLGLAAGDVSEPTAITGFTTPDFDRVQVSRDFAGALQNNGDLFLWGLNDSGQLGTGDQINRYTPYLALSNVAYFSLAGLFGYGHVLAIKTDGTLWGWGDNTYGQIGLGSSGPFILSPTQVSSDTWTKIHASYYNSVGIKSDGTLWSSGYNNVGQLGLGNTTNVDVFTQVGSSSDWVDARLGEYSMGALNSSNVLWMCGDGYHGRLGLSNQTSYTTLHSINATTFSSIGDLAWNSMAIGTDGKFYAWGDDEGNTFWKGSTYYTSPTVVGEAGRGSLIWREVHRLENYYWLLIDTNGIMWHQYNSTSKTQLSENEWTQVSVFSELLLAVNFVNSAFWTKFKGQTESI